MKQPVAVNPDSLAPPKGYNHGMKGTGDLVFVAGQVGWNREGRMVSDDFVLQFGQALENVLEVVWTAGGVPESVARIVEKTGRPAGEVRGRLADMSPQKRLYTSEEVSALVVFLCGNGAAGINGQALSLDGGTVV